MFNFKGNSSLLKLQRARKIKLVTHNSNFHSDDVSATAVLLILLEGKNVEIIRTRDKDLIISGDYVFDVGGIYDEEKNRFDHHQIDFNEKRENGIPYASFGLVWKKYGEEICNSKKIADKIDEKIVQPIDAMDNGVEICKLIYDNVHPYTISKIVSVFNPVWTEEKDYNALFLKAVDIVKQILEREIIEMKSDEKARIILEEIYDKTKDKRIIVLEKRYPWENVLSQYPEPLFVITKRDDEWTVKAVKSDNHSFENRKDFPESWAGKSGEELAKVTGVEDAIFCHKARFICSTRSKEGAIKLAQLALEF